MSGTQLNKPENATGLEEKFKQLEIVCEQLEAEDISLEDAFKAYSKGMDILKECNEQIDLVEKKVLKLSQEGQLEEF